MRENYVTILMIHSDVEIMDPRHTAPWHHWVQRKGNIARHNTTPAQREGSKCGGVLPISYLVR